MRQLVYSVCAFFARFWLSSAELNAFDPNHVEERETLQECLTVQERMGKVQTARDMRSVKCYVAFHLSRLRNCGTVTMRDRRGDDLVLRLGFSCRHAARYGADGLLPGRLMFVMGDNGVVLKHWLVQDARPPRPIDDLRLTVRILSAKCVSKLEADILANWTAPKQRAAKCRAKYEVTVDLDGAVSVFQPAPVSDPPVASQTADPPELVLARKIAGLEERYATGKSSEHLVTLFRRRPRKTDLEFPFRAAIWLNARSDDVPAPMVRVAFTSALIVGALVPFCVLFLGFMEMWDRWERALYLSAYFLTLLSVQEIIAEPGFAATNILRGFIRPQDLTTMACALDASVPQVLFLARRGGAWTENLDYSQLCFLGRGRRGVVKRDHYEPMNAYAVGLESFNKQYCLIESGVNVITGFPGEEGGHVTKTTEDVAKLGGMAYEFVEFDEREHYLAGIPS